VVLSTVGAYAIQLNGFHVSIMAAFGILGYLMRKMNIPPAPLVLGLLLGGIAEDGFVQSITIAKQSPVIQLFVTRPICIVLVVLIIISLLSPLIVQFASRRVKGVDEKKPDQILDDD
jgi:putative tricarboxylic transport membrane protein